MSAVVVLAGAFPAFGGESAPDQAEQPAPTVNGGRNVSATPVISIPDSNLVDIDDSSMSEIDPFAYHHPDSEAGEYIPTSSDKIPGGMRVVSILHVVGAEPIAAIHVPTGRKDAIHFVRVGDVIQVDAALAPPALAAPASRAAPGGRNSRSRRSAPQPRAAPAPARPDYVYLLVRKIDRDSVEIAPRARPHEAIILR